MVKVAAGDLGDERGRLICHRRALGPTLGLVRWTIGFALWTLLVWVGRVRNIGADEALEGFELVWRLGLAVTFVALGAVTLTAGWRASVGRSTRLLWIVRPFAVFTTVVWVVRAGGILLDGSHEGGFKVVHTVLAIVSIALAWRADREAAGVASRGFGPVSSASVS